MLTFVSFAAIVWVFMQLSPEALHYNPDKVAKETMLHPTDE